MDQTSVECLVNSCNINNKLPINKMAILVQIKTVAKVHCYYLLCTKKDGKMKKW